MRAERHNGKCHSKSSSRTIGQNRTGQRRCRQPHIGGNHTQRCDRHQSEPAQAAQWATCNQSCEHRPHDSHCHAGIANSGVDQGQHHACSHQGGDLRSGRDFMLATLMQRQADQPAGQTEGGQQKRD